MGIITILWEKWVEFRRDFYKITLAAMIAPLMYLIVFGMGIQTTSHGQAIPELPDTRCGITYNYERKFQCHCSKPECAETLRESLRSGYDLPNSIMAVHCRTDHWRKPSRTLCRRYHSASYGTD